MASAPKLISFFFLLAFFFMQTYARESQFFSKVPVTNPTPTTTINSKEVATIPNKEENLNKQEEEPTFMRETQKNGYGLYGQESTQTQFPTTTKLGNAPYTTSTYSPYRTQIQNQETSTSYPNTNTNYYDKNRYSNNAFEEEQQNLGETSLHERSYTPKTNQNNNYYYNGANGYKNEGKQGMSDTRYLQNGRYFFDPKGGNSYYNPNQYQTSRNNYDSRGSYYNNYENTNEYSNSAESYQNQENFQEVQDEHYVP
ncbi:hypothetical protein P3X46_033235 [Hevea brasiliensis]|uniref:Protein E6-like n=1 Tax=Hevea brasiliensis TaxID=3981 RepID=A0ABQ9KIN8_HEVBR|nr:protein E6-like [Hevea brasiliensis]KAJ9136127.1 hypothetical protein P3X46_033235 [Hevea brasiliensis]